MPQHIPGQPPKYNEHLVFYIKSDVFYIIFDVFRCVKIFYFTPFWGDITTSPAACFAFYGLYIRSFSQSASAKCPFWQISLHYLQSSLDVYRLTPGPVVRRDNLIPNNDFQRFHWSSLSLGKSLLELPPPPDSCSDASRPAT